MVLFAPMIIRKFREEGRREANNQPFTEPPPSQDSPENA